MQPDTRPDNSYRRFYMTVSKSEGGLDSFVGSLLKGFMVDRIHRSTWYYNWKKYSQTEVEHFYGVRSDTVPLFLVVVVGDSSERKTNF